MLGAALRSNGVRLLAGRSAVIRCQAPLLPQSAVSWRWLCSKPEGNATKAESEPLRVPKHRPTDFEKKLLVWVGRYKNKSEIPEFLSLDTMAAAKNKARIKFATLMMLMTIVGCIAMIISGKQAHKRNESVAKMNLDKKARLREEAEK